MGLGIKKRRKNAHGKCERISKDTERDIKKRKGKGLEKDTARERPHEHHGVRFRVRLRFICRAVWVSQQKTVPQCGRYNGVCLDTCKTQINTPRAPLSQKKIIKITQKVCSATHMYSTSRQRHGVDREAARRSIKMWTRRHDNRRDCRVDE